MPFVIIVAAFEILGRLLLGESFLFNTREGVPGLFQSKYAPADYMETVNTVGLPYYAKQWQMEGGKGRVLESQSNPLHLCTRPNAIVEITAT